MTAPLLLAAATLAAPSPATPGDWATVGVRAAAPRKLVRVYLVAAAELPRVRSARDPRLHYVGSGRARSGTVKVSFRVPPLNGRYRAWCAGCGRGSTLNVAMPPATADSCPVTIPRTGPPPGLTGVWHGNGALWTHLPDDGILAVSPEHVEPDGSVPAKRFWHAAGIDGTLTLSGGRLDSASPPLRVHTINRGTQAGFRGSGTWATFVTFPTQGCWRLTVRLTNLGTSVSLSFVMKVTVRPPAGEACAVTKPDPSGHYGTTTLWTRLPADGVLRLRQDPDGTLGDKLAWIPDRDRGLQLTVSGKRLDRPGQLRVHSVNWGHSSTGQGSWASAVVFPAPGCWRITGTAGSATVSYVVEVVPS